MSSNNVNKVLSINDGSVDTIRYPTKKHILLTDSLINSKFWAKMRLTHKYSHVFNKTICSLQFHPLLRDIVLIGSRGGDIACINLSSKSVTQHNCHTNSTTHTTHTTRGTNITDIRFDCNDDCNLFYTSSICGKISKRCIQQRDVIIVLLDHNYMSTRFTCLDSCPSRKLLLSGDNFGYIHFVFTNQNTNNFISKLKIHDSNIVDCEFNRFDSNIFSTSSMDRTAKIWDIRMISDAHCRPIVTLRNQHSINCATFSPIQGSTLLTTNYCDEIRCYRGPNWDLESCIFHSHQQLLRHSIIKAKWHPNSNFFVIASSTANYTQPQTVDIFNASDGKIVSKLSDTSLGVMSINHFNCIGDRIASTKAQNLNIFEFKNDLC